MSLGRRRQKRKGEQKGTVKERKCLHGVEKRRGEERRGMREETTRGEARREWTRRKVETKVNKEIRGGKGRVESK